MRIGKKSERKILLGNLEAKWGGSPFWEFEILDHRLGLLFIFPPNRHVVITWIVRVSLYFFRETVYVMLNLKTRIKMTNETGRFCHGYLISRE